MIYTTGTIAVSSNTLTGTGTNFTAAGSLIRNGCTVIVFSTPVQVFQITAIGSATSLTVTPAANPAIAAGTRYAILLSDSLSVDGLAQDIAETFGMYQRYMGGFADVMNSTGDVVITINGSQVTVPGQRSLAKKGANSDITSLTGLTTALSVAQGGTGGKNQTDGRAGLGAAASGLNTDITSATGLTTTIMRDQWVPDKALIVTLDAGPNVSYNNKAVTAKTMHSGLTMYTSFCYSIGADGTATNSGPALISTDGNSYTKYWKFQNGSGAITSHAGTFTPGVSDIRVKNEKRVITEQEAIEFISEWESIVYSLKWTPDAMRVGFRAQDIYERFPELIERSPLMDVDGGGMIEDGMIVNVAETATAYLVPVVQQLLRRVGALEALLKQQGAQP